MKSATKFIVFLLAAFSFTACQKEEKTGNLTVRMTDAPIDFDEVNVEISYLQVHYADDNNGNSGWVNLQTNSGVYNLLDLQNGVTTALVVGEELPVGKLSQLRMILAEDNSVVVDGISHPLALSSQDKTGLKINLNTVVHPGDDVEILIDFDAAKSIVVEGNGTFRLKPVVELKSIVYL